MAKIRLDHVRLSFPHLFEHDNYGRFSANFLIEPESPQHEKIKAAVRTEITEKWKGKSEALYKAAKAKDKVCLRDGNTKPDLEGYEDMLFLSSNNKIRPRLLTRAKEPIVENDGTIYSGCYVNAVVDIYAHKHQTYGPMVNCTLLGVQFAKDGDAFTASATASDDDFDNLGDTGDDTAADSGEDFI